MLCFSGFELYSRWVPLTFIGFVHKLTLKQCRGAWLHLSVNVLEGNSRRNFSILQFVQNILLIPLRSNENDRCTN